MEFRILGPLEVAVDGTVVSLGSAKQRALLGVLLLHANHVVSSERLVDELWGERPPPTAGKLVQVHVSQLRRALADAGASDVLRTRPPGYEATVEPERLDALRFERLVAAARHAAEAGRPEEAVERYDEALGLWRGSVLADVTFEARARTDAALLEELRLAALSEQADCALALGRHAELIGRLESLALEHPLHERFWAQLMLALYRTGRQSEALGAYHQARRMLSDEIGVEPGPELRQLEKAVLVHDPSLAGPAAPTRGAASSSALLPAVRPPRRLRRPLLAGAVAAAVVAAAALALVLSRGGKQGQTLASITPDSVVIVDPKRNVLADEIRLQTRPTAVAYGDDTLWVGAGDDDTLLQIDPQTHVVHTVGIGASPRAIAVAGDFVWVLTAEHTLLQLRSRSASLVRRIALPARVAVGRFAGRPFHSPYPGCGGLAADDDAAWVGCWLPVGLRIDARTGAVEQFVAACAGGIALGGRAVWCAGATITPDVRPHPRGVLSRVDPASRRITSTIAPPEVGPDTYVNGIVAETDTIWAISANKAVWRIDQHLGRATAVVSLDHVPISLAVDGDAVWTANVDGTLSRVDARSARLARTLPLGPYPRASYPTAIAAGGGRVWVPVH